MVEHLIISDRRLSKGWSLLLAIGISERRKEVEWYNAEVIANISDQLNSDTLNSEQEALVQAQLAQQEALELRHLEQQREIDREMDNELANQQRAVDDQINQQKRLVREGMISSQTQSYILNGMWCTLGTQRTKLYPWVRNTEFAVCNGKLIYLCFDTGSIQHFIISLCTDCMWCYDVFFFKIRMFLN